MIEINLQENAQDKVKNLSGKERGLSCRKHFKLNDLDELDSEIRVVVPSYIIVISSSFFLGMFSESVKKLGGRDGFLAKYTFDAPSYILDQISRGIDRAEMRRT